MKNPIRALRKLFKSITGRSAIWSIGPYLPCIPMNNIWIALKKEKGWVLDIGGGWGDPMLFLNQGRFRFTVNADCNMSFLREAKKRNTHDDYVLCDIRYLPFRRKTFDNVLCTEVIEHIEKKAGIRLIHDCGEIAKNKIILTAPANNVPDWTVPEKTIGVALGHVSSWHPSEFKRLGYKVRGSYFPRFIFNQYTIGRASSNRILKVIGILKALSSPLGYYFPSLCLDQTAIKVLDK